MGLCERLRLAAASKGDETMNATQKQILKDATKILKALRKADQHAEADRFARRVAEMMDAAA